MCSDFTLQICKGFLAPCQIAHKNDHRILISFGNNLKRRRKEKKLSLRQFAALADIDHAMIDRYERGITNPSLTTIGKLAEALEIEPYELLMKKG